MSFNKTHALANMLFVMHTEKQSIECGIHQMPEARQVN